MSPQNPAQAPMPAMPPLWTAIVTPLLEDGRVDFETLTQLLVRQARAGAGVVLLGSTGEGMNLGARDREAVVRHACSLGLDLPLMVGVGGSGRQSLTKLASYMCDYQTFMIEITKMYRSVEFHEDLKTLYNKTGVERKPTTFLFNDTQIKEESFLEDINSILSSGEVPNLLANDEMEGIIQTLKPIAQAASRPRIPSRCRTSRTDFTADMCASTNTHQQRTHDAALPATLPPDATQWCEPRLTPTRRCPVACS